MWVFEPTHMYAEWLKNRDLSVQILEQHVKNLDFFFFKLKSILFYGVDGAQNSFQRKRLKM